MAKRAGKKTAPRAFDLWSAGKISKRKMRTLEATEPPSPPRRLIRRPAANTLRDACRRVASRPSSKRRTKRL